MLSFSNFCPSKVWNKDMDIDWSIQRPWLRAAFLHSCSHIWALPYSGLGTLERNITLSKDCRVRIFYGTLCSAQVDEQSKQVTVHRKTFANGLHKRMVAKMVNVGNENMKNEKKRLRGSFGEKWRWTWQEYCLWYENVGDPEYEPQENKVARLVDLRCEKR